MKVPIKFSQGKNIGFALEVESVSVNTDPQFKFSFWKKKEKQNQKKKKPLEHFAGQTFAKVNTIFQASRGNGQT